MFRGILKPKPKNRKLNTPGIFHNKNNQIFAEAKNNIKNNRPHSRYILGDKGKKSKDKLPIQINNDKIKKISNNFNVLLNNNNNKFINFNNQKIIRLGTPDKNNRNNNFSENNKRNNEHNIRNENKEIKNNIINNNIILNNNNFVQFSKSLKKNNDNKIIFNELIDLNKKNNINIGQNNIKIINIKDKDKDKKINKILPLIKNDSKKNLPFIEDNNFKPDKRANQINLINKKKNIEIIKNIHVNPSNIMKGFINNNFNNNKKKIFVGIPEKKQINNIINININLNNNLNNDRYFMKNKLMENKDIKLKNRKNINLIDNRQNNFISKEKNNINNRFIIEKSIDDVLNRNKFKNNLIEVNNNINNKKYSSSEEPIMINSNLLKQAKINIQEHNNLKIIKPSNNKENNSKKIIDYFCKENINSKYNKSMEDFTLIKHPFLDINNNHLSLFAVFDGHGGANIAEYLKNNFAENLKNLIKTNKSLRFTDILEKSITNIDKNIVKLEISKSCGSTGTIVIVNNNAIYCANVGDSKCFFINEKEAKQLTEDHNCKNQKEVDLLKKKGVSIFNQRVYGTLSLTRSFGDTSLKIDGITADPYIKKIFSDKNNVKYIVIASDGIWDLVDEKRLYEISKELKEDNCKEFCNKLVDYALEKNSIDNISCIIIKFSN